jgi:hypothetical protein
LIVGCTGWSGCDIISLENLLKYLKNQTLHLKPLAGAQLVEQMTNNPKLEGLNPDAAGAR